MITRPTAHVVPQHSLRRSFAQLKRLFGLIRGFTPRIVKSVALGLIIGGVGLALPVVSKALFDDAYPRHDFQYMQILIVASLTISVTSACLSALKGYYGQAIGAEVMTGLSIDFYAQIQRLQMRCFDQLRTGDIISRVRDLQRAIGLATGAFERLVMSGMYVVLVPPILLALNWRLALLALAALPLTTTLSAIVSRRMTKLTRRAAEAGAESTGFQVELISNIRLIKALAAEGQVLNGLAARIFDAQEAQLRAALTGALLGAVNALLNALALAAYSWYAWTLILGNHLSLGSFVAFTSYIGYLRGPVSQFTSIYPTIFQISVSLDRFFELIDGPVEQCVLHVPRVRALENEPLAFSFEDVNFGYDDERPVLQRASFAVRSGEVAAFVGRTGAGKSSVVKLLLGMYQPQSGKILVDGRATKDYPLQELRRQFGVVLQDSGVFRGSVRDNLLVGTEERMTDDVLWKALERASIAEFIYSLPEGLDTPISEWGATLSGGQRQRLAIARAFVRPSRCLLLDEPTSNLDAATERAVVDELLDRGRATTVVLITHRLGTARLADRIFAVEDGRVRDWPPDGAFGSAGEKPIVESVFEPAALCVPLPATVHGGRNGTASVSRNGTIRD